MSLKALTEDERTLVLKCLRAVVEGPFISDGDFHSIFGLCRAEVAQVASRWPRVDESEAEVRQAINGSMNSLLIWFGWQDENPEQGETLLRQWTGVSAAEIERVFAKWRADRE
jgi:hypothetical protein